MMMVMRMIIYHNHHHYYHQPSRTHGVIILTQEILQMIRSIARFLSNVKCNVKNSNTPELKKLNQRCGVFAIDGES